MDRPPTNQEMSHLGTSGSILTRDECVCLSTTSILNQQAFMSNCGITIAALIDLHPPAKTRLSQVARQPCRCSGCGAFLNCYCKVSQLSRFFHTSNISRLTSSSPIMIRPLSQSPAILNGLASSVEPKTLPPSMKKISATATEASPNSLTKQSNTCTLPHPPPSHRHKN